VLTASVVKDLPSHRLGGWVPSANSSKAKSFLRYHDAGSESIANPAIVLFRLRVAVHEPHNPKTVMLSAPERGTPGGPGARGFRVLGWPSEGKSKHPGQGLLCHADSGSFNEELSPLLPPLCRPSLCRQSWSSAPRFLPFRFLCVLCGLRGKSAVPQTVLSAPIRTMLFR